MCLIEHIFCDITSHDYDEIFELSAAAVGELWSLVGLSPLMCTDLRAAAATKLTMVDASDDWMASVETEIGAEVGEELERHQLTRASWSKLLSPLRALMRAKGQLRPEHEVPEGEEPLRSHPMWTALVRSLPFGNVKRKRVKRRTHINLDELTALLDAERENSEKKANCRHAFGSDSQVVLGAVVKGRSSSASINYRLRSALPTILGQNTYSFFHYVYTGENPADDPTRDREVRAPVDPQPEWLAEIRRGEFNNFDDWLVRVDADLSSIARLPQPPEPLPELPEPPTVRERPRQEFLRTSRKGGAKGSVTSPVVAEKFRGEPWLPCGKTSATARALLQTCPADQFVLPKGLTLDQAIQRKGHLDIFSGSRGAAKALAMRSGRFVLTFDTLHSASEDLLDDAVRNKIERLVELGAFLSLTGGPVCASFSRAVRPAVRDRLHPRGRPDISVAMRLKVAAGNSFSDWVGALCGLCHQAGMLIWSENPRTSMMWIQAVWVKLLASDDFDFLITDYCRWGTPWRKRTAFCTNIDTMKGVRCYCQCTGRHQQLVGYAKQYGKSWTKVAEPYPKALCSYLARALVEALKPVERRKRLDIGACAKCNRRVGEASHPGPRRRQPRPSDVFDLEEVQKVQPATLVLQRRVHQMYAEWLADELSPAAFSTVHRAPALQTMFLRAFGNHLFSVGKPMYLFRHLTVLMQQRYPAQIGALAEAWELLSRWEIAEPVSHRPPLPKLVLDGMIALALSWGWIRWATVTMLSFHGAMRIGEPLKALREDLLLPADTGLENLSCFLLVRNPKSSRRGKGRIQHARIRDENTVRLAIYAFQKLSPTDKLYAGTNSAYRARWDKLCAALAIPQSLQLTPGCLRGGGCIFLYHQEVPVMNILWQMRIKQLSTLEHYLQETAAINIAQKLPMYSRTIISNFANILPMMMRQYTSN